MKGPNQLKVRNWEQFQHYKDRNPPWIKLHFALLSSEDWVTLADASKLLVIACMLVASRNKGMVPNNPAYMKRVAYLDQEPDFGPLISCGFLENPLADASAVQAVARPETETEQKDTLSETSSDEKPKARKRKEYTPPFEAIWLEYPTDPNMSKADAFDAYVKLDAADKDALAASIRPFRAYCRANPDYRPKHMVGFIKSRRFDGFQAQKPAANDDQWRERLIYARREHRWAPDWGPRPGEDGCCVPPHLIVNGDGSGWGKWESAA